MRYTIGALLCVPVLVTRVNMPLHAQASGASTAPTIDAASTLTQYVDVANGVGLDELVQLALTRNGDLLATRQRTVEAQGLLRQAGFRPNPVLETEFGSGSPTGSRGEQEFSIGYAHTFELGAKRARRVDLGRASLDLARFDVTDRERTLRAELQERYIAAMAAIRNIDAIAQQLESTQQAYVVTQRRVSEGESPRVEEMVLQAEVGRLVADRLVLIGEAQQAMLDLRVVAGLDLSEPLRLRPDGDRLPITLTIEAALERGLAARPDLAAARQEEAVAPRRFDSRKRSACQTSRHSFATPTCRSQFPQFGLTTSGALTPLRDRDRILTGGLSLTLPLLSRNQGHIEAARRSANGRLRCAASTWRERSGPRSPARTVGHLAARRAVQVFESSVIQPSQESVRVLRASYVAGEVRLFDVLTEQRRLIDTQKAYTDAIRQEALARVAVERAIGAPLP